MSGEDARALSAVVSEVAKALKAREESAALAALRHVAEKAAMDGDTGARRKVMDALRHFRSSGNEETEDEHDEAA